MPRRRNMQGGAFWNDLWSGIKSVGNTVNNGLKKTKIISRVAPLLGHPAVGKAAAELGYGRRRRRRPAQAGGRRRTGARKMGHF